MQAGSCITFWFWHQVEQDVHIVYRKGEFLRIKIHNGRVTQVDYLSEAEATTYMTLLPQFCTVEGIQYLSQTKEVHE